MEVTLVKNPARRKKSTKRRATKKTAKRRSKASYAKAAKKAAATRKRNASKRSATAKKAAATRKRNARKSTKRKATRKTATRKAKATRSRASYRAAAKKAAATRKRNASKRSKAGKKAAATRRKNSKRKTTRRNSSARRRNPDVVKRLPIVGKTKTAKWFDGEMSNKAHGAQMWKQQKLTQKVVTSVGAFSGYGYGGTFTQMGHGMTDNALTGSLAGVATGIGGITLASYGVNKVGSMVAPGHEKKHHTFANFTKGWRMGGYLGVGLNTVTNLLTMHYGRSYGGIGSWSGLVNELSNMHNPLHTVKKMIVKGSGAHKLAHLPSVAGFMNGMPGMYADGPNGPLQGFAFGNSLAQDSNGSAAAHPADIYTDAGGYYADQNEQLGFVDVLGNARNSQDVGYVDVLGYPSGIGYPAEFAENQPLYG